VLRRSGPCIDAAVDASLLDGTMPAEGTGCAQEPGDDPARVSTAQARTCRAAGWGPAHARCAASHSRRSVIGRSRSGSL